MSAKNRAAKLDASQQNYVACLQLFEIIIPEAIPASVICLHPNLRTIFVPDNSCELCLVSQPVDRISRRTCPTGIYMSHLDVSTLEITPEPADPT